MILACTIFDQLKDANHKRQKLLYIFTMPLPLEFENRRNLNPSIISIIKYRELRCLSSSYIWSSILEIKVCLMFGSALRASKVILSSLVKELPSMRLFRIFLTWSFIEGCRQLYGAGSPKFWGPKYYIYSSFVHCCKQVDIV